MCKKILIIGLIATIVLTTSVFAAEIVFTDVEEHWAKNEIYQMANKWVILGYPDLSFKPNQNILKSHSFLMFARLSGYFNTENEVLIKNAVEKYEDRLKNEGITEGIAEISFLIEKDVISIDDVITILGDEKEDDFLTRQEAAYIFVKLLKDEENLNIFPLVTFDDAELVDEQYVAYVEYVNKIGLMIGDQNLFDPLGYVTRAQTATILSRVDNIIYDRTVASVSGLITQIDMLNNVIKIDVNGDEQTFILSRYLTAYDNNTKISKTILKPNDNIVAYINDGLIEKIIVNNIEKNIYAIFSSFETIEGKQIVNVIQGNANVKYNLVKNISIIKDGKEINISLIKENENIELIVVNNSVEKIIVGAFNYTKQGEINEIIIGAISSYISIKDVYGETNKYQIAEDVNYDFDGAKGNIYDLRLDMDVKLTVTHNGVTKVKVETLTDVEVISGTIQQVIPNIYVFIVKTDNGNIQMIFLDEEETFIKTENGIPKTIDDIKVNDIVSVYGRYEGEVFYPIQVIIY